jgi:hypothetical protein
MHLKLRRNPRCLHVPAAAKSSQSNRKCPKFSLLYQRDKP